MGLQLEATSSHSGQQTLSLEALDALPQSAFVTTTIWTDGAVAFSGVSLKTLLDHFMAKGVEVELVALNDYAIKIPFEELEDDIPIIATRMGGEVMSVRDKGPFWLVYPYDSDPKYRSEVVYSRSIWQLSRVKVLD